ncbi:MAG: TIGR03086 family metal-binding protein, partial [Mycobacteriales bacterium]
MSQHNEQELHARASARFTDLVHRIGPADWDTITPCPEWTVRDLVGHLVGEARWTAPLLAGRTIADVGDSLDGDLLGDDPVGAWDAAAAEASSAVQTPGAMDAVAHLSFGDFPGRDYTQQLIADHH